jgi:hypothetical protein
MKNLILYGSQNLSNEKCNVEEISNFRGSYSAIQKVRNARFAGSTVVDKKVEERSMTLSGVLRTAGELNLQEVINEYSKAFDKHDRYFRIVTNYHIFTTFEDGAGWQVQGDSTQVSFDEEVFQYGLGSAKFDSDVSVASGYSGIYTLVGEETELASYGNRGAFEAWVYLPQTTGVTSIELKVGNDASAYYSGTTTSQYDGTPFELGWNFVSILVEEMDITGTLDTYGIGSYVSVKVNYSDTMEDRDGFRVGGVLWQEEERTRNFRSYVEDFNVSSRHYDITRADFQLYVFAYEGIAESTGDYNVMGSAGESTATYVDEITLDGTYTPLPRFTIDITAATNVSKITLANITTGDSVDITRTYAAGDRVVIDTDNREVLVNGAAVDYDDVLPRFILGENDIQVSISTTGLETIDELTQNSNLTGEV